MTRLPEEEILKRLDQLVKVTAIQVAPEGSLTERARLLKLAGLDNKTIAEVLNTSDATIRSLTSNLKRRKPSHRSASKKEASPGESAN